MVNWLKTRLGHIKDTPLLIQLCRFRRIDFPLELLLAAFNQFNHFLKSDAVESQYSEKENLRQAFTELELNHHLLLAFHNLGEKGVNNS